VYDRIPADFPMLHCIARVALARGGKVSVMDYGGAFGSSYRQCRAYLPELSSLKWNIVEQPLFVESGRQNFQTSDLQFDESIDSCLAKGTPDVVLLSSVLQYLRQPYELLDRIASLPIEYLVIDRHPCSLTDELITVQTVPPNLYPASYPSWLFDCNHVASSLGKHYELLVEWEGKDPPIYGKGIGARFKGSFWRKRSGS
jgi:putative methyltransferase (TIGR04325 family)